MACGSGNIKSCWSDAEQIEGWRWKIRMYVFACDMIQYRMPTFQFRSAGKITTPNVRIKLCLVLSVKYNH